MLSASQIVGFLNQLFLQNKWMKQPHFMHVDIYSQKLKVVRKFFAWAWLKHGFGQSGLWILKLTVSQE